MGSGHWDSKLYASSSSLRAAKGINDFAHSADTLAKPTEEWKPHNDLDPAKIKDSINGVRESRDSTDHPESLAVGVILDVTGSMRHVPRVFQENLNKLMSLLMLKGKVEHPQILVGGVGDATSDHIPLQLSQFESNNLIDEHIRKIVLEGNGGGQKHESYGLALYAMARLTDTDCFNKRGKKGYLFLSGDELPYEVITREEINAVFGIGEEKAYISFADILNEVKEKYEVFFIIPSQTMYQGDKEVKDTWSKYLPERVLHLEEPASICELIASVVASIEGVEIAEILESLKEHGTDNKVIKSVSKTLAAVK
jgi:hypothetical protein